MEKGRGLPLWGNAAALSKERNEEKQNESKDDEPDGPVHHFLALSSSRWSLYSMLSMSAW